MFPWIDHYNGHFEKARQGRQARGLDTHVSIWNSDNNFPPRIKVYQCILKRCLLCKTETGEIIIHVNFWLISNAPSRISAPVIKGDALIRHYYGYYTPDDSSHWWDGVFGGNTCFNIYIGWAGRLWDQEQLLMPKFDALHIRSWDFVALPVFPQRVD